MPKTDPRVEGYIQRAPPFARPLLTHFRHVVHDACPGVEETIKWGSPFFLHHGILCGMAAFKQHCAVTFWKGSLLFPPDAPGRKTAMGQLGRLTTLSDFPPASRLRTLIHQAMVLNETGQPRAPRTKVTKQPLSTPPALARALKASAGAQATWKALSPSHRREYAEWITEAKRDETRARRVATAIEWLEAGKSRNWKYQR